MQADKSESLQIEILDAKEKITRLQADVVSLTQKYEAFNTLLEKAKCEKEEAQSNQELFEQIVRNSHELRVLSSNCISQEIAMHSKSQALAGETNDLLNHLTYSANKINRLAILVTRKKHSNPLISSELVSMLSESSTDANNAMALSITACKSVFTAEPACSVSKSTLGLINQQSNSLSQQLVSSQADNNDFDGLSKLIDKALNSTTSIYEKQAKSTQEVEIKLSDKKTDLEKAELELESLQVEWEAIKAAEGI